MQVICSYCNRLIFDNIDDEEGVTHTICQECHDYFIRQWKGLPLYEYLDRFASPVMIMDADCRIIAANRQAASLTGRARSEVVGLLGGEALECSHARLPGGCGKTIHCETCTIRYLINDAFVNEKPRSRFPVKIKRENAVIDLFFSALKIGDLIQIMVER